MKSISIILTGNMLLHISGWSEYCALHPNNDYCDPSVHSQNIATAARCVNPRQARCTVEFTAISSSSSFDDDDIAEEREEIATYFMDSLFEEITLRETPAGRYRIRHGITLECEPGYGPVVDDGNDDEVNACGNYVVSFLCCAAPPKQNTKWYSPACTQHSAM